MFNGVTLSIQRLWDHQRIRRDGTPRCFPLALSALPQHLCAAARLHGPLAPQLIDAVHLYILEEQLLSAVVAARGIARRELVREDYAFLEVVLLVPGAVLLATGAILAARPSRGGSLWLVFFGVGIGALAGGCRLRERPAAARGVLAAP